MAATEFNSTHISNLQSFTHTIPVINIKRRL